MRSRIAGAGAGRGGPVAGRLGHRDREGEARAEADAAALGPDAPPLGLDQALADGEAQPAAEAALPVPGGGVFTEQLAELVRRDAPALVGDRDRHIQPLALRRDPDGRGVRRVARGVGEQVVEHLHQRNNAGRGALRRELTACLRTGRALRVPRARRRGRGKEFVGSDILISERPAEAEDRAVPGHWEGDLIIGLGSSAIGTLVERTTRFTMLLQMAARGRLRVKNGPALAGHGAEAVRDAITSTLATLPDQLRRSLTWDQGAEMAQHAQLRIDTGLDVFFCDPRSPWQRGTNENTNGLLRQYFPKGTDLNRHSASDVAAVAATLNRRPRKTLGWKTPSEAFNELLL